MAEQLSAEERAARGKALRKDVPLESHADFRPSATRDPIGLLIEQSKGRVPDLVPIRYGRMLVSPFTFYRGAALIMADDLAQKSATGLSVQLCGDAHLLNFGGYASPERRLVFDINDFDETSPGPFEWDVKRLAASFVVAGRDNEFSAKQCREVTLTAVRAYREAMRDFAAQPILEVWYARLDVEDLVKQYKDTLSSGERKKQKSELKATKGMIAKAHTRNSMQAIGKLTTVAYGQRRIVSSPPLIVPIAELAGFDTAEVLKELRQLVEDYRQTLQPDRRHLVDQFQLTDVAHKVVGVGSVGTRAWILLMESAVETGGLLLQAKEALPSVLSSYAGGPGPANQGERVVAGQRMMQATSDIFLGWLRADSDEGQKDYYVRQLRDWKVSADIEGLNPEAMALYARLCGWTLARAHARSGDRFEIAAYLGKSGRFDNAVTDFAHTYADQNENDHEALQKAVADGRVEARSGL
jgi:uncharacterized protein (DUF2252 family)